MRRDLMGGGWSGTFSSPGTPERQGRYKFRAVQIFPIVAYAKNPTAKAAAGMVARQVLHTRHTRPPRPTRRPHRTCQPTRRHRPISGILSEPQADHQRKRKDTDQGRRAQRNARKRDGVGAKTGVKGGGPLGEYRPPLSAILGRTAPML